MSEICEKDAENFMSMEQEGGEAPGGGNTEAEEEDEEEDEEAELSSTGQTSQSGSGSVRFTFTLTYVCQLSSLMTHNFTPRLQNIYVQYREQSVKLRVSSSAPKTTISILSAQLR